MTDETDPAAVLLAAYDEQLRGDSQTGETPSSVDGPVVRVEYPSRGFVSYRSLESLDGAELDALIARQRDYFAAKGQAVEWKTRGHDLPGGSAATAACCGVRAGGSPILQRLGFPARHHDHAVRVHARKLMDSAAR